MNGPIIPFGAGVKYKPSRPKDIDALPKLVSRMLRGAFRRMCSTSRRRMEPIELTHAQETSEVRTRRVSANEITIEKKDGKISFPVLEEEWESQLAAIKLRE